MVVGLNTIVSRSVDPSHFMVINPGMIQAGQAPNVIPDSATVGISVRTRTAEDTDLAFRRIEELTNGICAAYGATVEYEWVDAYDIVYNDAALAAQALQSAKHVAGDDNAWEGEISSGSEDFSAFANEVPGCFIILGGGDAEQGYPFQNHHPSSTCARTAWPSAPPWRCS
ncbi:M20/M25/M40 family metallo-hydrolase [Kocuria atrinae]|uniref:M20/M25/M40 family metallo-hydrolase n=1 Tax=Kocuria atrinae TaxID=592377 RepID=UPI0037C12F20